MFTRSIKSVDWHQVEDPREREVHFYERYLSFCSLIHMDLSNCSQEICFGHGVCLEDVSLGFHCECDYFFMEAYNCSLNYFHVYHNTWIAYFFAVSLLVFTVYTIVVALYFIAVDFANKNCRWGLLIHVSLIMYRIINMVYLFIMLEELENPDSDMIVERAGTYFYFIGLCIMFFCLLLTVVIWINILLQVKRLQDGVSNFLRVVRPIVIVYSIIMVISIVPCLVIQANYPTLIDLMGVIINVFFGIALLVGSTFSLYGARLIYSLKKYVRPELAAKYPVLLSTGVMGFLILIIQAIYVIGTLRRDAGLYLAFNYLFQLFEVLYTILILLMLDTGRITFSSSSAHSAQSQKSSIFHHE
eukprot:TRINITY_DN2787_c0_g1_i1.p1 TRINITY_DN2787_c0_g1~~TRINITY_DN2787_c0_g1_i1.p1  ORF type:complete len:358 (-),score=34.12 TRINITY_DN2787_c0_g1_i1:203-1276(-)